MEESIVFKLIPFFLSSKIKVGKWALKAAYYFSLFQNTALHFMTFRIPQKDAEIAEPSGLVLLQSTVSPEVRNGNAWRPQATTHNQFIGMSPLYLCDSSSFNADCDDRPTYRDADTVGRPHQHPSMELRCARDLHMLSYKCMVSVSRFNKLLTKTVFD